MNNNLLFIGPFPPPFGGIAVLNKALMDAGLKDHFDLFIIDTTIKGKYEKIGKKKFKVILHSIFCYFNLFFTLLKKNEIENIYITGTCNTGLIRDFGFILISRLFKKRILFNFHGTRKYYEQNGIIKRLTIKSIQWSNYILSPSKKDWTQAIKILPEYSYKIQLFYNSTHIDDHLIENNLKVKTDNKFRIIGTGRLSDAKGTFDLIEAFLSLENEYKEIELSWIGRGADPSDEVRAISIINKVHSLNLRVNFLKDLSEKDKFRALNSADIFILPTRNDNLPVAILEALAVGLPVISTYMGAIPEVIIPDVNGWLINPGDIEDLKRVILHALNKTEQLKQISENNINLYNSTFKSKSRVNEIIDFCNIL